MKLNFSSLHPLNYAEFVASFCENPGEHGEHGEQGILPITERSWSAAIRTLSVTVHGDFAAASFPPCWADRRTILWSAEEGSFLLPVAIVRSSQ